MLQKVNKAAVKRYKFYEGISLLFVYSSVNLNYVLIHWPQLYKLRDFVFYSGDNGARSDKNGFISFIYAETASHDWRGGSKSIVMFGYCTVKYELTHLYVLKDLGILSLICY